MNFEYKNIFSIFVKFIFLFIKMRGGIFSFILLNINISVFARPSLSLNLPTASLAAYSSSGAAAAGDYSAVDVNSAVLAALKKQYTLFGNTAWQTYANLLEVGVLDNTTTAVAALIRVRESIPNSSDSRDRRFTLGLAYQIPGTRLSLGFSFDYQQLSLRSLWDNKAESSFAGGGFLYEFITPSGRPIFLGAGINRVFDTYNPVVYDTGISTTFLEGFYIASFDVLSSNISGLQKIVGSIDIIANQFLDLKGSYGYAPKDKKNVWGAGLFFNAPVLRLFYTFSNSDSENTPILRQTAGCALNFVF